MIPELVVLARKDPRTRSPFSSPPSRAPHQIITVTIKWMLLTVQHSPVWLTSSSQYNHIPGIFQVFMVFWVWRWVCSSSTGLTQHYWWCIAIGITLKGSIEENQKCLLRTSLDIQTTFAQVPLEGTGLVCQWFLQSFMICWCLHTPEPGTS